MNKKNAYRIGKTFGSYICDRALISRIHKDFFKKSNNMIN